MLKSNLHNIFNNVISNINDVKTNFQKKTQIKNEKTETNAVLNTTNDFLNYIDLSNILDIKNRQKYVLLFFILLFMINSSFKGLLGLINIFILVISLINLLNIYNQYILLKDKEIQNNDFFYRKLFFSLEIIFLTLLSQSNHFFSLVYIFISFIFNFHESLDYVKSIEKNKFYNFNQGYIVDSLVGFFIKNKNILNELSYSMKSQIFFTLLSLIMLSLSIFYMSIVFIILSFLIKFIINNIKYDNIREIKN